MTMSLSLRLKRMRRRMITEILSVSWGFNICTTEDEPHVNGHLFVCSPVLYHHLGSLIYLDGVSNSYSVMMCGANSVLSFA